MCVCICRVLTDAVDPVEAIQKMNTSRYEIVQVVLIGNSFDYLHVVLFLEFCQVMGIKCTIVYCFLLSFLLYAHVGSVCRCGSCACRYCMHIEVLYADVAHALYAQMDSILMWVMYCIYTHTCCYMN